MLMVLGGCDVLVFSGGIGRNSASVRAKALEGAEGLGFLTDPVKNTAVSDEDVQEISRDDSPIKILAIRTFEEIMIARECLEALQQG
jgi:acetate kinase